MTKKEIKSRIDLHKSLIPEDSEWIDFDENKKDDYLYCIEWGMRKQKWIEKGIHESQIKELEEL